MDIYIEEKQPHIYRIVVHTGRLIHNVFEREDYREPNVAKLSLFGLAGKRYSADLGKELDRFLFLN